MITVAVTGGIGSGKSTICSMFRAMRIPVLSADDVSRDIANTVPAVRTKIISLLGATAYTQSGRLNRPHVSALVFSNPRLRTKLESILHPLVLRRVRSWFVEQKKRGKKIAMVEAALVFESGLDAQVDLVLVIDASKKDRMKWIQKRDGSTKAQIQRRMSAQMDDAERRRRADVLIKNPGRKSSLRKRARYFIDVLRTLTP